MGRTITHIGRRDPEVSAKKEIALVGQLLDHQLRRRCQTKDGQKSFWNRDHILRKTT